MLSVLTVVTDPGEDAWVTQFKALKAASHTYYSIVIIDKPTDRIVAVGTVFVERKFLRGLGSVGHIEDIAVDERQQGKKLGLRIIQALTRISENSGCYKTILNCSDKNMRECHISPLVALLYSRLLQLSTRNVVIKRKKMRWYALTFYSSCLCSPASRQQAKYAPERSNTPRL